MEINYRISAWYKYNFLQTPCLIEDCLYKTAKRNPYLPYPVIREVEFLNRI